MNKADCICELKWLRGVYAGMRKEYGSCVEALGMAINALEQTAWIPCEDRLPDAPLRKTGDEDFEWFEGEQVLICDKDGLIHVAYIVKDYIFNDIYWCATDADELRGEEVKAWMPLPAPYKEDIDD